MAEIITRDIKEEPLTWSELDSNFKTLIGMKHIDLKHKIYINDDSVPTQNTLYFLKVNNEYLTYLAADERQMLTMDLHISYKPLTSQIYRNIVGRIILYKEKGNDTNNFTDKFILNTNNLNPVYTQINTCHEDDCPNDIISFDGIQFEKGFTYFGIQIYDEDTLSGYEIFCEITQYSRTKYLEPFLELTK